MNTFRKAIPAYNPGNVVRVYGLSSEHPVRVLEAFAQEDSVTYLCERIYEPIGEPDFPMRGLVSEDQVLGHYLGAI